MVVFPAPPTSWLSVTRFGPNLFGSRYGSANNLFPQKFDHRWVQICSNRFGHIGGHHFLPRQQTNTKDIAGQSARQQCHLEMYEGSRQCMNAVMTPTGATGLILINLQCCGCFPFSSFVSKQFCCDPLPFQPGMCGAELFPAGRGGAGRGQKSAGRGKRTHKSTDPKIRQKCVYCYGDIYSVL